MLGGSCVFTYFILILSLFLCAALWKPMCLFKLCYINKVDWIGLDAVGGLKDFMSVVAGLGKWMEFLYGIRHQLPIG